METDEERAADAPLTIYTIGHSNQPMERFLALLERHGIQILADVRSQPYSRYVPHFNQVSLEDAVERRGIQYLFLGQELGGRPIGDEFYDAEGYVLYGVVAEAPFFRRGIERLKDEAALSRVAVMCSEEDPTNCHRRLLIARVLAGEDVRVLHLRSDGAIQEASAFEVPSQAATQLSLFDAGDAGGAAEGVEGKD
ncbi:MAG TPA: DUF488 domain-containing protein, partial [Ktedonobacterales bacterium]